MKIEEVIKLRNYLDALIQAEAVLAEPAPEPVEAKAVDLAAWQTAQRNKILASSGDKAALLGTLADAPAVTEKTLTDLDVYPSLAADIVKRRDEIRAAALALTIAPKVEAEPIEEVKP